MSKSPQYNLTISYARVDDRDKDRDAIKTIMSRESSITKQEGVIGYLLKGYEEGYAKQRIEMISEDVPVTLDEINCAHLQFDSVLGFMCYKGYYKNKKISNLGNDNEFLKVKINCKQCRIDEQLQIEKDMSSKIRDKNLGKVIKHMDEFLQEMELGKASISFYMCYAEGYPVSTSHDQEGIYCPKRGHGVSILEHCIPNCNAIRELEILGKSKIRKEFRETLNTIMNDLEPKNEPKRITQQ